jgi:ribosomal protein S18 acetylase RimI-like enzyme
LPPGSGTAGVLSKSAETAFEHGRNVLRRDAGPGTWRNAVVAEIGDEIVGVSVSYGIDASILEIEPKHPVLAPLLFLQKEVVGHWFIDSLGVYRHYRGKGIGRALLENEFSRAGQAPVSLITESHNETAQALYRLNGFRGGGARAGGPCRFSKDSRKTRLGAFHPQRARLTKGRKNMAENYDVIVVGSGPGGYVNRHSFARSWA